MDSPFLYGVVGLLACFIGTIPFGPINLAVAKSTVDHDRRSGMQVAVAASLVEMVQALIAISFGMLISDFLDSNAVVSFSLAFIFIALALFIYTRKPKPAMTQEANRSSSFFVSGLIIAGLNPQAVPFWIFALATISQYFAFQYEGIYLVGFLLGVFVGKLLALTGFAVASSYLKTHLEESSMLVNRLLAAILLFIGLSQGWNAVNSVLA